MCSVLKITRSLRIGIVRLVDYRVRSPFNLIDGVDGLAASLGILTMLAGSYFRYWLPGHALLVFAMAGRPGWHL